MASVSITKHTMVSASSGQINHCYRTHENYSNKDIDFERSSENIYLGCHNANEARIRLHERVDAVDAVQPPKRVKKDRVVCVEYELPAPREGMSENEQVRFLRGAYNKLVEEYGEDIICGAIHGDEVHNYSDSTGQHVSRIHLHVLGVPRTEEKGINGKAFLTRNKYREVNELMDELCIEMFGYPFQDGTKQKSRGTVEQLKQGEKNAKEYEDKLKAQAYDGAVKYRDELVDKVRQGATEYRDKLKAEIDKGAEEYRAKVDRDKSDYFERQKDAIISELREFKGIETERVQQEVEALKSGLMDDIQGLRHERDEARTLVMMAREQKQSLEAESEHLRNSVKQFRGHVDHFKKDYENLIKYIEEKSEEYNIDFSDIEDVVSYIHEEMERVEMEIDEYDIGDDY
jgi:hypothetical protein